PFGSVTVPLIVPVVTCACAMPAKATTTRGAAKLKSLMFQLIDLNLLQSNCCYRLICFKCELLDQPNRVRASHVSKFCLPCFVENLPGRRLPARADACRQRAHWSNCTILLLRFRRDAGESPRPKASRPTCHWEHRT